MKGTVVGLMAVFAAVGALFVLSEPADASLAHFTVGREACRAFAVRADADTIYLGKFDATVEAVDRENGQVIWRALSEYSAGGFRVNSMAMDDERIYVAVGDDSNNLGPVVALDKETGAVLWQQTNFFNAEEARSDPLRVTTNGNYVFVGFAGAIVVRLTSETGEIGPVVFRPPPTFRSPHGAEDFNVTQAMAVSGNRLWVSQTWPVEGAHEWQHWNNSIYHIDAASMTLKAHFQLQSTGDRRAWDDGSGQRSPVFPPTYSMYADPAPGNNLYFGVIADSDGVNGVVYHVLQTDTDDPPAPTIPGGVERVIPQVARAINTGAFGFPGLGLGGGFFSSMWGDGTYLYAGTTSMEHADAPHNMGGVIKLTDFDPSSDASSLAIAGWVRPELDTNGNTVPHRADGRFVGWGSTEALYAEPGPAGSVFAANTCYPYAQSSHKYGKEFAVVTELAKDESPSVILVTPTVNDIVSAGSPIAIVTDYPSAPVGKQLRAEFFISAVGGQCADGTSCYSRLEPQPQAFVPAQGYFDFTDKFHSFPYPEGNDYRLKVVVWDPEDPSKRATDYAEGSFIIDRGSPEIHAVSPPPDALLTDQPGLVTVDVTDFRSGIDEGRTRFCIDKDARSSTGWVVCLSGSQAAQVPMLMDFFTWWRNGVEVKVSKIRFFDDGLHTFGIYAYDRAGNLAYREWNIKTDQRVSTMPQPVSPQPDPKLGYAWLHDSRPVFAVQFLEDVRVLDAILDGANVTTGVELLPRDSVSNPLGTRLLYRDPNPLATAVTHEFTLRAVDDVGNIGGPYLTRVKIDSEKPRIDGLYPSPGALLATDRPQMRFRPTDSGSGLNLRSLSAFLDGKDVTSKLDGQTAPGMYLFDPDLNLKQGEHTMNVAIVDVAGNLATAEWSFIIDLVQPRVQVEVDLPPEQSAVKAGDKVVIRVSGVDESEIRRVFVDASALDSQLPSTVAPKPLAGQPGVYELSVVVSEGRSEEVQVSATVEDVGGFVGFAQVSLLVDNVAPAARMKEMAPFVGASFSLEWEADGKDLGSGISHYRLERRENEGEWKVVRPRVDGTGIDLSYPDGSFTRLAFRVLAIDRAGNIQATPSNEVSTIVRGDPFETKVFDTRLVVGEDHEFTATPRELLSLESASVFVTLTESKGGFNHKKDLESFGRFYKTEWQIPELTPGDYLLRFHFRGADGFEMAGSPQSVKLFPAGTVLDVGVPAGAGNDGGKAPAGSHSLILLVLGLTTLAIARSRRGGEA